MIMNSKQHVSRERPCDEATAFYISSSGRPGHSYQMVHEDYIFLLYDSIPCSGGQPLWRLYSFTHSPISYLSLFSLKVSRLREVPHLRTSMASVSVFARPRLSQAALFFLFFHIVVIITIFTLIQVKITKRNKEDLIGRPWFLLILRHCKLFASVVTFQQDASLFFKSKRNFIYLLIDYHRHFSILNCNWFRLFLLFLALFCKRITFM